MKKFGGSRNKNYKYILVLVDVFSKRAYAEPMTRMTETASLLAMKKIFDQLPQPPQNLVTDRGTEFFNSKMKEFLLNHHVNHYSLGGPHKASHAERFIRTLKSKIEKFFWETKSHTWIKVLPKLVEKYNASPHQSIKMAPNAVNYKNRSKVFKTLYPKNKKFFKPRLSVGDLVRVKKFKNIFEKGYTRKWSLEIFKIIEAKSDGYVDFYRISHLNGHVIKPYKYYYELNRVAEHDSKLLE